MNIKEKSKAWRLNFRNFVKGSLYAIATALFTEISTWTLTGLNEINYNRLLIVAISGLAGYLLVKLPQNENGNLK